MPASAFSIIWIISEFLQGEKLSRSRIEPVSNDRRLHDRGREEERELRKATWAKIYDGRRQKKKGSECCPSVTNII